MAKDSKLNEIKKPKQYHPLSAKSAHVALSSAESKRQAAIRKATGG